MMHKLVNKILWQQKNRWELILAAIGFFLGLALFLFCLQVYLDITSIFNTRMRLGKQLDYLIISKKVETADLDNNPEPGFSREERAAIAAQPFVLDTGVILSNAFAARAGVELLGNGFVTELFFEAVEDRFLDFIPAGWDWKEGDKLLPVMISRDFLMLYNFGFSQARGFPFVSEEMLGMVPVQVIISNARASERFNARIKGLSDRVASILVPYSFMTWANTHYSNLESGNPLRLILSVKDRSDPRIIRFLEAHNYETSKEKLRLSDAGFTIAIVLGLIAVTGLILICLSFVIFVTTFRLVISRSNTEITLLVHLGYTPLYLARNLMQVLVWVFTAISAAAAVTLVSGIGVFHGFLADNGFKQSVFMHPLVPCTGLILVSLALFLNYLSIRRRVHKAGDEVSGR